MEILAGETIDLCAHTRVFFYLYAGFCHFFRKYPTFFKSVYKLNIKATQIQNK